MPFRGFMLLCWRWFSQALLAGRNRDAAGMATAVPIGASGCWTWGFSSFPGALAAAASSRAVAEGRDMSSVRAFAFCPGICKHF